MASKKRIMMISTHGYVGASPEYGKPDTGGQVAFVLELSKCLAHMGYQADILTRRFEWQSKEEKLGDRVRILRFPCGGRKFISKEFLCEHIPEWVSHALEHIQKKKLQYAFMNSHYWDAGIAGRSLALKLNIPHLHTPHSIGSWKRDNMDEPPEVLEEKYNFKKRIREEKVIYDECDAVIATTPQQRDILATGEYDVPKEKVHVIPPGYDDSRFFPVSIATRDALKKDYGLEGRIILALGRMAHNKGYDLLIKSMPSVFSRVDDAKLLLAAGSTEPSAREKEQIEELHNLAKELKIEDRVIFRNYIEDEELPDFYRMADVFALSSRYEPFGMTAIEAMACGTPTVVTTEGGLWERVIWGLEAIYANPFDPEAFGHAICSILLHSRLTGQLAKYGSQKARANFTWNGVAQQTIQLLETLPSRVSVNTQQPGKQTAWIDREAPFKL